MDLPSTYQFRGWNIRYSLKGPEKTASAAGSPHIKSVVFVHGTPWSSAVYRPVIEALLARGSHRILVYDLPGYGQSQDFSQESSSNTKTTSTSGPREEAFPGDTSVKFQAEVLTELLKHVQLDGRDGHPTPAVIAHDIAGSIVLRAHLLHDCEFDTMMLVDANAVLPWGDGFYKLARSEPQPFVKLPPSIFEAVLRAVIRSACHNPQVLQSGWEDILAQPWLDSPSESAGTQTRQRSFVRQIAQANDSDVAEMLEGNLYERVRCDVKIVWGEQDQWIPRDKIEDVTRRLKSSWKESAFIPEAGHLVMIDQPARFAIEVFDWLTRFGSARSLIKS